MRAWGLKAVSLTLAVSLFLGLFANQAFAASESNFTVLPQTHVQPIPLNTSYDTSSGAFDYAFAIPLPPGVNGHTPELSIAYNSHARNTLGQFGLGWRDTLPYIAVDTRVGVEDLYSNPIFFSSLDGELAEVSSTSFQAEVEQGSFRKYEKPNATTWVVTEKDGMEYTFANTQADPSDATQVFRWYLSTSTDANGNTISYTYHSDQGQLYPDTISYGPYTVSFGRATNTNPRSGYASGFFVRTALQVDEISVAYNGSTTATYDLVYTNDRLTSITPTTDVAKPAVVFEYSTAPTSPNWTTSSHTNGPSWLEHGFFGDMDGDGLPELIEMHEDNGSDTGFVIYKNTGTGWTPMSNVSDWVLDFKGINGDPSRLARSSVMLSSHNRNTNYETTAQLVDINSDGRVDVVFTKEGATMEVYINTGSEWDHQSQWDLSSWYLPEYAQFGDINGDGLLDYIRIHESGTDVTPLLALNTGNGWSVQSDFDDWFVDIITDENKPDLESISTYLSSSYQYSARYPTAFLVDVNVDGLVDIVRRDNTNKVYINTGEKWATTTEFSHYNYNRIASYVDINGDGLPDSVLNYDSGGTRYAAVHLNTGSAFASDSTLTTMFAGFTQHLSGSGRYTYPGENINVQYHPNGRTASLADVNGDGAADYVETTNGADATLNDGSAQNLLVAVTDTADNTRTEIAYQAPWEAGTDNQQGYPLQLVDTVQKTSDVVDFTDTYSFSDGDFYVDPSDPSDRRFAGFGEVTKTTNLGKETTWYHQANGDDTASGEGGDTEALIGQAYRTEITDLSDNLYRHTQTDFDTQVIGSSTFVKLASTVTLDYDGDSDERAAATSYTYDNTNGSILSVIEHGEVNASSDGTWTDSGSDDRTTTFTYATSTDLVVPATETVTDSASVTLSQTRYLYDGLALGSVTLGNLTSREGWISGSDYVTETFTYDTSGNVLTETDGEGNVTTYAYDSYDLYPTSVTNDLSQTTTFAYDYRTGQVGTTTDPNGHVFVTTFDGFGRPISETIPDPQTGNPVIKTEWAYVDTPGAIAVTQTSHLASSLTTDTVTYSDGFGNVIQERREGENDYAVRDFTYGDNGLLASESLPYFSAGAAKTSATTDSDLFSSYTYDPLGRVTLVSMVVGGTVTSYDQWQETVTDASGVDKDFTYDAFGRLVTVTEHEGSSTFDTDYEFDGLHNLTKITDADGNEREIGYDGLSRRTSLEDLHDPADSTFGTWSFSYDDASNLTSQTDPNNQTINWTYDDLNRQLTEDYTGAAGTEITYAYDSCANGVGQLCSATTPDVTTAFTFTENNLPASEAKTIDSTTYTTSYEYDRQGNQTELTYPDNSQVRYSFNAAGQVESVEEKESGGSYATLVADVDYGPHGKETYLERASGIASTYTFDAAELYRLRSIESGFGSGGPGAELQALEAELFATEVIESAAPVIEPEVAELMSGVTETSTSTKSEQEDDTEPIASSTLPIVDLSEATTTPEQATSTPVEPIELASTSPASSNIETIDLPEVTALDRMVSKLPFGLGDKAAMKIAVEDRASYVKSRKAADEKFTKKGSRFELSRKSEQQSIAVTAKTTRPEVRLKTLDGEVDFGIRYEERGLRQAAATLDGDNLIRWRGGSSEAEVHAYPLPASDDIPNGGIELEVVLTEPPSDNTFVFRIDGYKDLEFEYQPALTEDERKQGLSQPENQAGSYSVYRTIELDHSEGKKYYQSTKVFDIYRPKITDADGNEIWGEIEYSKGRLVVEVPKEFLATAAYPVVVDPTVGFPDPGATTDTQFPFSVTSMPVGLPTVSSGDLLLAWVSVRNSGSWTVPTGWQLLGQQAGGAGVGQLSAFYRIADGTEGSSATWTASGGTSAIWQVRQVTDWDGTIAPEISSGTSGDVSGADSDSLSPSWGSADTTWLSIAGHAAASNAAWSAGPSGYSDFTNSGASSGGAAVSVASAYYQNAATSEDPGTFTPSGSNRYWAAFTIAVKPGGTGTSTPPSTNDDPIAASSLETNAATNPVALTTSSPDFTAIYNDPDSGDEAIFYQLQVDDQSDFSSVFWDSTKTSLGTTTEGTRTAAIAYSGPSLASSTDYYWRIKFWDQDDAEGVWSTEQASFSLAAAATSTSGGSGGSGAFPTVGTAVATQFPFSVTSMSVNLPTVSSGDLLLAWAETRHSGSWTVPTGWQQLGQQLGGASVGQLTVFYKIADGTEGTSVTWTASAGTSAVWQVRSVSDWDGSVVPEIAAGVSGDVSAADPGSLSPSWGSANTTWIAIAGHAAASTNAWSDAPTDYTDFTNSGASAGGGAVSVASAYFQDADAAEDPGTFTPSGSNRYWAAFTIAVKPGAGSSTPPDTTASSSPVFYNSVQNLTYTYDSVGNITQLVDASETVSAATTTYTYDDLNRLTAASTTVASSTPYSRTFSFDAIGNLTNKSDQGSYTYSGAGTANPHAATQIGSVTYTYDDNGNLTSNSTGLNNVWSYRNELLSSTQGTDITSFVYDHAGQRMKKVSPDSTVTYYPFGHYEVRDGEVSTHIYLGDRLIATREDGKLTDVHTDHLGSTRAVTDQTGATTQVIDYYPYGGTRIDDQYGNTNQGNRYTGHDYDEETNLNYMKARYQDGATARFLSQDPLFIAVNRASLLTNPQRMNSYGYALNNPMVYDDPTGESASFGSFINFSVPRADNLSGAYITNETAAKQQGAAQLGQAAAYTAAGATGVAAVGVGLRVAPHATIGAVTNMGVGAYEDGLDGTIDAGWRDYTTRGAIGAGAGQFASTQGILGVTGIAATESVLTQSLTGDGQVNYQETLVDAGTAFTLRAGQAVLAPGTHGAAASSFGSSLTQAIVELSAKIASYSAFVQKSDGDTQENE